MTLGTARKISGLPAYLAWRGDGSRMADRNKDGSFDFFVISVWSGWWRSRSTTDDQRRALVDHELCHLWSEEGTDRQGNPTGKIALSLLPHDLTEFNEVVYRHGAWQPDIDAFLKAYHGECEAQPGLFDEDRTAEKDGGADENDLASITITAGEAGRSVRLTPDRLKDLADDIHKRAGLA